MANHLIHDKLIGAYVYAIVVDGVDCYIGKGRRTRAPSHIQRANGINKRLAAGQPQKERPFHLWLAEAVRDGREVAYRVIANGLDDASAFEIEAKEVAAAEPGQLWNVVPGGAKPGGEFHRALWQKPEFRDRMVKARQKTASDPAWRQKLRENALAQWADPEKKLRHYEQHRKLWDDPVAAEERRELLRKVWADPEKSKRKSALVKSQWTPERKAAMAENRRRAWADPEFKARAAANIAAAKAKKAGK